MTYQEYARRYPILQSFHTGRWGFARVYGCLDLSQCIYLTPQAAGKARKAAYRDN